LLLLEDSAPDLCASVYEVLFANSMPVVVVLDLV